MILPLKTPDKIIIVRTVAIRMLIVLGLCILSGISIDFVAGIYGEYHLSRTIRYLNHFSSDPFIAVVGFPFLTQALHHHYKEIEIKAAAVPQPVIGQALLEATMYDAAINQKIWQVNSSSTILVEKLESRIIIDTVHLGRYLGIPDLMVEAPSQERGSKPVQQTESGISGPHGLTFTGTPPRSTGYPYKVSISVDLSMQSPDRTTLVFTPTGVLTGPGTADRMIPPQFQEAVFQAFSGTLPHQRLPFGIPVTTQGARGSDIILEGIAHQIPICLDHFTSNESSAALKTESLQSSSQSL